MQDRLEACHKDFFLHQFGSCAGKSTKSGRKIARKITKKQVFFWADFGLYLRASLQHPEHQASNPTDVSPQAFRLQFSSVFSKSHTLAAKVGQLFIHVFATVCNTGFRTYYKELLTLQFVTQRQAMLMLGSVKNPRQHHHLFPSQTLLSFRRSLLGTHSAKLQDYGSNSARCLAVQTINHSKILQKPEHFLHLSFQAS